MERRRWTLDDCVSAADLARQGVDAPRIAEELERSESAVRAKLGQLRKGGLVIPRLPRRDPQITIDEISKELARVERERKAAEKKGGK